MYESFYLRAVAPDEPLGVWIRYTVHKRSTPPGRAPAPPPRGSLWFTLFDAHREGPFMHKLTTDELSVPPDGWIAVGDSQLGPARAEGACGEARWSLDISGAEPELRHLPSSLLYRTPLPRTKLTSPLPAARFDGVLEVPDSASPIPSQKADTASREPSQQADPAPREPSPSGGPTDHAPSPSRTIELRGWRGMVGHNWGSEHAERWVWLHGIDFHEDPQAWIDVAVGRVRVAGRTTPWVANGALHLDGERHPLGGLGTRGLLVAESPQRCTLVLPGPRGLLVEAHAQSAPQAIAGWRYADPDGAGHDVCNCSIAALTLTVRRPGLPARTLRTSHGAAYELGMREHDHGIPIAPFPDG
jgi:hypothetical protein